MDIRGTNWDFVPTLGAVALGAQIVERHITLDKGMKGNDHRCSLNIQEFEEMIRQIRVLDLSIGIGGKQFQSCEEQCFAKLGKSVVASRDICKGHKLELSDMKIKVCHPKGARGQDIEKLCGKILTHDVKEDCGLTVDSLEMD